MKAQTKSMKTILVILVLSIPTSLLALEARPIAAETEANALSVEQGRKLWEQTFAGKAPLSRRSCTSCHGESVQNQGKHIRTNKPIKPMAPSINPKRFTDPAKVEKWFLRNCKWTIGRECTAQEKGDIIAYLKNQ